MFKRILAVFKARNKEFSRDRSSLGWNFIFPILMIAGFAAIFSDDNKPLYTVGVMQQVDAKHTFLETKHVEFVDYTDKSVALNKLERFQLDLFVDIQGRQYWVNDNSPEGYVVERLLLQQAPTFERHSLVGKKIRYVDWVVPGILGMNMMFSSLFGVGYVVVRYRKNAVLKRLQATPLTAFEFVTAQVASRLSIVVATNIFLFTTCNIMFDFYVLGSYFDLLVISALSGMSLIALGLVFSSRSESEEFVGGILNLATWPMMVLSGVWFSLESAPEWLQQVANIFPLTHGINAAREVMLDGKSLLDVSDHLIILVVMMFVCLLASASLFKWNGEKR